MKTIFQRVVISGIVSVTLAACYGSEDTASGSTPENDTPLEMPLPVVSLNEIAKVWRYQPFDPEVPSTFRTLTQTLFIQIDSDGEATGYEQFSRRGEDGLFEPCYQIFDGIAQIEISAEGEFFLRNLEDALEIAALNMVGENLVISYPARTEVLVPADVETGSLDLPCETPVDPGEELLLPRSVDEIVGVYEGAGAALTAIRTDGTSREYDFRENEQCYYEDTSELEVISYVGNDLFSITSGGRVSRSRIFLNEETGSLTFQTRSRFFDGGASSISSVSRVDLEPEDIQPICISDRDRIRQSETAVTALSEIVGSWQKLFSPPSSNEVADIVYWVIRSDNSFSVLDYQGDSADLGEDCYAQIETGTLIEQNDGGFSRVFFGKAPETIEFYRVDGDLRVIRSEVDEDEDQLYEPSEIQDIELSLLCPTR